MEFFTLEERNEAIFWLKKFFVFFHHFYAIVDRPDLIKKKYEEEDVPLNEESLSCCYLVCAMTNEKVEVLSTLVNSPTLYELSFVLLGLIYNMDPKKIMQGFATAVNHFAKQKFLMPNILPSTLTAIDEMYHKKEYRVFYEADKVIDDFLLLLPLATDNEGHLEEEDIQVLKRNFLETKPRFFLTSQ